MSKKKKRVAILLFMFLFLSKVTSYPFMTGMNNWEKKIKTFESKLVLSDIHSNSKGREVIQLQS